MAPSIANRSIGLAAAVLAAAMAPAPVAAAALGCLITPSKVVELGSPAVGVIGQVHVDKGQQVKAQQTLITLRADVEQANVALAVTRADADAELQAAAKAFEFAKRKHERNVDLMHQGFVSSQAVDQSLADLQAAEAKQTAAAEQAQFAKRQLYVARAELAARTIRSPIDGVVVDIYRHEGERVEDKPMLKLARVDPLYAEVVLPANLHRSIRTSDRLAIRPLLPGLPDTHGEVQVVDQLIDPASNTFRVRLVIPNTQHAIPAGVRCEVTLPDELEKVAAAAAAVAAAGKGTRAKVAN